MSSLVCVLYRMEKRSVRTFDKYICSYLELPLFYSPERDLIREKHEEIITQLNERMAEKAK